MPDRTLLIALIVVACLAVMLSVGDGGAETRASASVAEALGLDRETNHGELVLDIEAELFGDYVLLTPDEHLSPEDCRSRLARLLQRARHELGGELGETLEPREMMSAIHELLADEGFRYHDYSAPEYSLLGYHTLHFALAKRELDCTLYTQLYLAIGEELELPLAAVSVPAHLFVRWQLSADRWFDWEVTRGEERADEFYATWKNIAEPAIEAGVYLRSLRREEALGLAYYERATVLAARGELQEADLAAARAAALAPRFPDVHDFRGGLCARLDEPGTALESFDRALVLDADFAEALYHRALLHRGQGRLEQATQDARRLRELESERAQELAARLLDGDLALRSGEF
jgi:regulator of sirC expression with transglutaminase-like and TPR domain